MTDTKKDPALEAVYGVIWEWGTFTTPEIVHTSQVTHAKVMKILDDLQGEGIVELEDFGSYKLYRLTDDPEKRKTFLKKYMEHKSPRKPNPDSAQAKRDIEEIKVLLDDIDQKFNEIASGTGSEFPDLQKKIVSQLELSEAFLCSALYFTCGEDKEYKLPENHPARGAKVRFDKTKEHAKEAGIYFKSGLVNSLFGTNLD